jgi:soluble lytic murein transglycosylase
MTLSVCFAQIARLTLAWAVTLTPLVCPAQNIPSDGVILDMAQAYRKGDSKALATLLPKAKDHLLEPWAAYWELATRLGTAQAKEVDAFLTRYQGSYQEDRLRNDYLLLLGQRRDWLGFSKYHSAYRMQDDVQVRCYALVAQSIHDLQAIGPTVSALWLAQREADDACTMAVGQQVKLGKLDDLTVWKRARQGMEYSRPRVVQSALALLKTEWADTAEKIYAQPEKFLEGKVLALRTRTRELVTLALVRLAVNDVAAAREQVSRVRWRSQLTTEELSWVWAVIGRQSALNLSDQALDDFARAKEVFISQDHLAWKARAALRAQNMAVLLATIEHMGSKQQAEPVWVYWRAKALSSVQPHPLSGELFKRIAGPTGFYEQLALEELGQKISTPPAPPLEPAELQRAQQHPGLRRAVAAIELGLRSEGVREWNYITNLHDKGGMGDAALRGAAQWACELQLWDRCINTSDRTDQVIDWSQRYPTPLKGAVLARTREIDLDPAYVYGLMRQESRFVVQARSGVGASGLMQVMPATAKWTAKKIGMTGFTVDQLHDEATNIAIGTAYLKLVLDEFEGHTAMAAGAYNAGPSRVRFWRMGPRMEAAAWIENIPFTETRDYVKKVLSNSVVYASLLTGQPQSLKARLPQVGPRKSEAPVPDGTLP